MFAKRMTRWVLMLAMLAAVGLPALTALPALGVDDSARKVKTKIQPAYPELAKRMNLSGTVKCQVIVASNGTPKTIKPTGGNPVLIEAATDALKRWRWEPGGETTEVVEIRFARE